MSIRLKLKSSLLFFSNNSQKQEIRQRQRRRKKKATEKRRRSIKNAITRIFLFSQQRWLSDCRRDHLVSFWFLREFSTDKFFFHRPTIISSYDRTHTDDIVWITSITHITNLKQVLSFHHTCKRWLIISWSKVVLSLNREFFCSREQ